MLAAILGGLGAVLGGLGAVLGGLGAVLVRSLGGLGCSTWCMCEHVCVQCPGAEGFSTDSWPPGGSLEKISKVKISLVCLFLRIPKDFPTKNCPE